MDKRFLLFILLSVAILGSFSLVQFYFFPPPAVVQNDELADEADAIAKDSKKQDAARAVADKEKKSSPSQSKPEDSPVAKEPPANDKPEDQPSDIKGIEHQLISLGSLSPDSPFRFLATFDNRGATIRRIELNERTPSGTFRFRDVEDKSGYLGDLGLNDETVGGGCRVNVVGAGTPAATAKANQSGVPDGLSVGDVIVAVDSQPLSKLVDELAEDEARPKSPGRALLENLKSTRPGAEITLAVQRDSRKLEFKATLIRKPLEIIRPEPDEKLDPLDRDPQSLLLSLGKWENDNWDEFSRRMRTGTWQTKVETVGESPFVEFTFPLDAGGEKSGPLGRLEVVKRFRLVAQATDAQPDATAKSYHLVLELEIRNLSDEAQTVAYQLDGPTGLPLEGWWYTNKIHPKMFQSAGARDIGWDSVGRGYNLWGCPAIVSNVTKEKSTKNNLFTFGDKPANRTLRFASVDAQYFVVALKPADESDALGYVYQRAMARPVAEIDKDDKTARHTADVSFRLISEPLTIEPQATHRAEFVLFAGPKDPYLLDEYGLGDAKTYGWFWFVSKPLTAILHIFYSIVGNYGLAIIMLTILVRGAMVPVSRKAARNAQMMQHLQPEMKKIADKYKNDIEKRGQAQRELFAKYNYNPFGGCLLMFLQLPVFIGLYRGLSVDLALRDQPLIPGLDWCSNLAGPDQLWYWKETIALPFLTGENGYLGPYLNILPLFTVVLFIIQQKMFTPPATDEQTRMTQQMMTFMTVFIGIMFFKVPSGLCIYFITSSLWGIIERKILPKPKVVGLDDGSQKSAVSKKSPKPGSNGSAARAKERERQRRKRR